MQLMYAPFDCAYPPSTTPVSPLAVGLLQASLYCLLLLYGWKLTPQSSWHSAPSVAVNQYISLVVMMKLKGSCCRCAIWVGRMGVSDLFPTGTVFFELWDIILRRGDYLVWPRLSASALQTED